MSSLCSVEQVEGKHFLSPAWLEERKLCGQKHRGDSKHSDVSFPATQPWELLLSSSQGKFSGNMYGGKYPVPPALETFISTASYDSSHEVFIATSHADYLL